MWEREGAGMVGNSSGGRHQPPAGGRRRRRCHTTVAGGRTRVTRAHATDSRDSDGVQRERGGSA
jgi:hypothetical protein